MRAFSIRTSPFTDKCPYLGINHNGDMDLCKKLIMLSKTAGADYVKIQKRNPDVCVPEAQKSKMCDTPWGRMTYLEYK